MEIQALSSASLDPTDCSLPTNTSPKSTAIQRFRELLFEFVHLVQNNQRLVNEIIETDMRDYQGQTEQIKGQRDSQGWKGLELTLAGASLAAIAPLIPHLNDASLDLKDIFNSLGGIDTIRKLCETGSGFAEGIKPVATTWDEAKLLPQQSKKEFLEHAFRQGQQAEKQSEELVSKLLHLADQVYHTYSETGYRR